MSRAPHGIIKDILSTLKVDGTAVIRPEYRSSFILAASRQDILLSLKPFFRRGDGWRIQIKRMPNVDTKIPLVAVRNDSNSRPIRTHGIRGQQ